MSRGFQAPLRILIVSGYYKPARVYGGPVQSVAALCEGLARAGAEVTVFTTNANGRHATLDLPTDRPLDVGGVQVRYFPLSNWVSRLFPFYFYSPQLGRACREEIQMYDVIYLPGIWTYPFRVGARAALDAKKPYVVSPNGSFMNWSMQQRSFKKRVYLALFERRLIDRAAAIHLTTKMEADQQAKYRFVPNVVTIPNGINLAPFEKLPARGKLRQTFNMRPDDTLSLFVGRLHKEKRPQLMVAAFSQVARQDPHAHLLIVGPDQDGSGKQIRDTVMQAGLAERVHFSGLLEEQELLQAYADADLLVLLSYRENFGMVVAEAMAAGLPVLLSAEVGLAEDVSGCGAGMVVAAREDIVSQEWIRLIQDSQFRQQLGAQGRELVRRLFTDEIVAERMLELFQSVIK